MPTLTIMATIMRRSVACAGFAAFVLIACLHLALRPRPWVHEWYWTVDAYHFVTILLAPVVAGTAAWDGARWSGASDAMVTSHGLSRAHRSAWLPSAAFGSAAYVLGLVAASVITKSGGTPGWPSLAVLLSVAPPLALIALSAVLGATAGWVTKRALVGPAVAVGVFVLLLAGYTTLPETVLRIGGATASLLALRPRLSIQGLQAAFYATVAVAATFVFLRKVDRLSLGRTAAATAVVVATGAGGVLAGAGGMRFVEASVDVTCTGTDPTICLAPSYDHLRDEIAAAVTDPFRRFTDAGFDPPDRLTQDFIGPAVLGTATLPARSIDVYDVEAMMIFSIIPADCDIFRDEATFRDYSDVAYWVESLLGIAFPDDPTVSEAVADGDTPAARRHVRRIERELATCGP